ncbi:tape measure protein [Pseudomonas putida]|uniref:tape measure protein n=1 Tax=Pseudomonas putida TaxID=303 RepID=UPI0023647CE9|nr:tape measure protein [Pseudomonas putida]MDD2018180.1 tape measure protein [Pseudomonas putida]
MSDQESRLSVTIDSRSAQRDTRAMTRDLNDLESAGNSVDPAMRRAGASIDDAGRRASTAGSRFQGFGRQAESLVSSVSGLAAPLAAAFSAAKIAAAAEQYTNLTNRLRLVTEGAEQLAYAQQSVYEIAQNARQPLEATAQVYQRIAQNGRQLGLSFADVASVTETVAKTVALSGASAQAADAAMVQFGQALASGTLRGDELNSILEQTPALAQAIARGLGVTIGQLRSLGSEGKLTSAAIVKALQDQKAQVDELSSSLNITMSQALTAFNNSLVATVGRLDEATGASSRLATGIAALARAMDGFNSGEFLDFFRTDKQTVAGLNNELSVTLAGIRDLQSVRSRLAKDDPSDTVFFKFKFYDRKEIDAQIAELEGKAGTIRTIVSKMQASAAGTGAQKPQGENPVAPVNAEYEKLLASLKKQAALQGKNSEAAKVRYAIETGEIGKLLPEQEKLLLKYAEEKDAKVAAEKASKAAATAATKANSAASKGVPEAMNTFAKLYAQYDPAAEAARALAKEQTQLQLALDRGKISQEEYGKALAQASINYAAAIKGAQGLTQAEQYRAQLERQLSGQRSEYSIAAAGVGMGDQQTQRMQQRVQLEQQTNDRILQLRTELANATTEKQRQDLQAQIDLTNEFLPKQLEALQNGWAQMDQAMLNPINGWTAAVQNFGNQAMDVAGQTQSIFSTAFGSVTQGLTDDIMNLNLSFQSLGDLGKDVLRDVIAGFVKMGVQMGLNAALAATLGTATAGTSIALAGTTAAAWAPAAALASLASFGGNSIPAAAALTSTTALATTLAAVPGFATGGYFTGSGTGTSDSNLAKISNGEFIVNASATRKNRALLEAINSGERVSTSSGSGAAGSVSAMPQPIVQIFEDPSKAGTSQVTREGNQDFIKVWVASVMGDGEADQALRAKYGLQGVGS